MVKIFYNDDGKHIKMVPYINYYIILYIINIYYIIILNINRS